MITQLSIRVAPRPFDGASGISISNIEDFAQQVVQAQDRLQQQWAAQLLPITTHVIGTDAEVSGSNLLLNPSATSGTYFNSGAARPNTVLEQVQALYTAVNSLSTTTSAGMTNSQLASVGLGVFGLGSNADGSVGNRLDKVENPKVALRRFAVGSSVLANGASAVIQHNHGRRPVVQVISGAGVVLSSSQVTITHTSTNAITITNISGSSLSILEVLCQF